MPCAPQALIQQLLVDVSRHMPAFALELLAVQVLNEPTNLEMSTIGLRSLRAVVLSPPTFSRTKVGAHWAASHRYRCCMHAADGVGRFYKGAHHVRTKLLD